MDFFQIKSATTVYPAIIPVKHVIIVQITAPAAVKVHYMKINALLNVHRDFLSKIYKIVPASVRHVQRTALHAKISNFV